MILMNLRFKTVRVCSAQGEKTQDEQEDEGRRDICLLHPSLVLPLCCLLICKAEWQTLLCHQVRAA